jgi:hypothetical protein
MVRLAANGVGEVVAHRSERIVGHSDKGGPTGTANKSEILRYEILLLCRRNPFTKLKRGFRIVVETGNPETICASRPVCGGYRRRPFSTLQQISFD